MSIMSSELLNEYTADCVFMNEAVVLDGYGGYITTWSEGAPFSAVITEDSSLQAETAGIEFSTSFYGIKVDKNVPLDFPKVFKRLKDGKTFRIRNSEGLKAPSFSPLNMKMMSAEEYSITETHND